MPRKPSKRTYKRKLDQLVGKWCREIRSEGKCERCGRSGNNPQDIQWAHIKSRRYLSTRWSLNNCFCLCATCHRWFTDNPDEFYKWIDANYSEQYERLMEEFKPTNPMGKVQMQELYDGLKIELSV